MGLSGRRENRQADDPGQLGVLRHPSTSGAVALGRPCAFALSCSAHRAAGASARAGSHMLNVKNARLRSEHDVNLLKNRLERLRQEERKALKKIEETRRRADQIVSYASGALGPYGVFVEPNQA